MAAAVLGKRSRRVLDEEDIEPSQPIAKRRTRRSTPKIYEDTEGLNGLEKEVTRSASSVRARNRRLKDTVQDELVTNRPNTTQPHESLNPSSENVPPLAASTPSTVRFKDVFATQTPSTPKHRVRLGGQLLTPRSARSSPPSRSQNNVYAQARQLFTQASNGKIIGRDAERNQLRSFISSALENKTGGCTYVSGPPGTGKSALVQEILQEYGETSAKITTINCVALKSSAEVLSKFNETFSAPRAAKSSLARLFTSRKADSQMHLVLLDEIDSLIKGDCDVLYSIFEWAMHPSSTLILIGIANALDLTDRFLPKLKTKNFKPSLLPFLPYSATQISTIISEKLRSLLPADTTVGSDFVPLMHPAAIQLSGKKIAAQTGDLRKAFSLVRLAIDQIEQETVLKMGREQSITPTKQPLADNSNLRMSQVLLPVKSDQRSVLSQLTMETAPRASIGHVAKIASKIFNNGTLSRLGGLNLQQKAVLCSLVASEHQQYRRNPYMTPSKSWSKVPTIKRLFEKYAVLCRRDDGLLQPLKSTEFRDVVASLETLGLLQEASGRSTGLLTPSKTPSRVGKAMDDMQVVSAVSEKEMRDSLTGPGSDLLLRLLDEDP
ncbi:Cell division control protein 18 [Exophiala dermatitidis]